jgi:hypothetical protein
MYFYKIKVQIPATATSSQRAPRELPESSQRAPRELPESSQRVPRELAEGSQSSFNDNDNNFWCVDYTVKTLIWSR